jgi:hypothetical protein
VVVTDMGNEPGYLTNLKKYGAGDPTEDEIEALENDLYMGPDRAAAIVLATAVENAIGKLLRSNMREEGTSELFKPSSLLGSFGARIDISYALKLFGPKTKKELNIIRTLRNQFAHSRMPIEFTTPVVKKCCDQLTYPDAPNVRILSSDIPSISALLSGKVKSHPRVRYFISCDEIIQRIYFIGMDGESSPRSHLLFGFMAARRIQTLTMSIGSSYCSINDANQASFFSCSS